jgi:hypothetical protein
MKYSKITIDFEKAHKKSGYPRITYAYTARDGTKCKASGYQDFDMLLDGIKKGFKQ